MDKWSPEDLLEGDQQGDLGWDSKAPSPRHQAWTFHWQPQLVIGIATARVGWVALRGSEHNATLPQMSEVGKSGSWSFHGWGRQVGREP